MYIALAGLPAATAATGAPLPHAAAPSSPTPFRARATGDHAPTLADLSAALLHAVDGTRTRLLVAQMDTLRRAKTAPATALLQRRAARDMEAQQPDSAVEDLGDAMALQPDLTILRRDRAAAAIAGGHDNDAITDLGLYLQAEPDDPQGWAILTQAEVARKDMRAAFRAWQRVLALAPQWPDGTKQRESLRMQAFGRPT
ncbi:hypothetical protein KGY14_03545 [Ameyamaea chiangmaiensis]|nr:hypothetical protein [Ameyamaea chiangmaiensis]MBS4074263.1 hypothetical protein [Ameyamaea chiangmaiensis]